ncbi:MAG: zinc ribbon domain-containing protein [Deltaproteobacteria bacterium]|nr:zinc ribbon domain-containing protein [Deltaproteobacteria bacterium]MBW1792933.1 zinc ribbon domain-containing protein [Deltaproteobacteria bacterium]MBW2329458.1 zinc ribbon domain-containing protein [Deltaproteobacteria bacterium]
MPIYEFYCEECNTIFNFFSRSVNTTKRPLCPRCKQKKLKRQMSTFARLTGAKEGGDLDDLPMDEAKMEKAMNLLAREADIINEDDPRQAVSLMRKLSDVAGIGLGPGMEEALKRMEAGEDPEQVEAEMGDLLEQEEPFVIGEKKGRRVKRAAPHRDETLYDL